MEAVSKETEAKVADGCDDSKKAVGAISIDTGAPNPNPQHNLKPITDPTFP